MKRIYILLLTVFLLSSCVKDIPIGFLSDDIRAQEDTLAVTKGLYILSKPPFLDGSTLPLYFEVMNIRDADTGERSPEFFTKYPVRLWTESFHPDKDTTLDLINAKLKVSDILPLEINNVSGAMRLNQATMFIKGDIFNVDVSASNASSKKVYEDYMVFQLRDIPWLRMNNFGDYFEAYAGTKTYAIKNQAALPDADQALIDKNEHPNFHIERTGDSENVEVKLSFLDANGKAFHGKAIAKWPSTDTGYLNSWFDNSVETEVLDDGVIFKFPTTPFPYFGRSYGGTSETERQSVSLSYYTLHPNYYTLTDEALRDANTVAAENGTVFTAHNLRTKIVYQMNVTGKWEVTVKFDRAILKK